MNTLTRLFNPAAWAALLGALLVACGGGDGTLVAGVSTGGTGAYSSGAISGFGSVIVNGIEFDDSAASVLDDDGNPVARSGNELRLGMTVGISGGPLVAITSAAANSAGPNATAKATTIRISSQIVGPVSAVDAAAGTLTVLGQTVRTNAATVLDASASSGLTALLGQVVEVYALPGSDDGGVLATRVELSPATTFKLCGLVAAADAAARTLRVGALTLSYAGASNVPATLSVGDPVRLAVPGTPDAAGVWAVTSFLGALPGPGDGQDARVEGLVSDYVPASGGRPASFRVGGVAVDAGQVGNAAALSNGAQVEVRGRVSGGTLVANGIDTSGSATWRQFDVTGSITAIDRAAQTFVVRGVTVAYAGASYPGGSSAGLVVGARVEVSGMLSADRTQLMATQIEFDRP